jgi:hypothetical protein
MAILVPVLLANYVVAARRKGDDAPHASVSE